MQLTSRSANAFLSLPLVFVIVFSLIPNFPDKAYADDNYSESENERAPRLSTLLEMDIKNLMQIEVVSATRSVKPLSETAENMEIITAKDIEFMNAHTVAEVLNTVTGVQVRFDGPGPGTISAPKIQGSNETEVTVLIDGVPVNSLASAQPELMMTLPVQIVERIEIIKGPASSAWGSSLGGIINIITKSGYGTKGPNGTLSASYGEKNTGDYRADVYGTKDKFEYYLYTGHLRTDGLRRDFDVYGSGLYSKLAYNITPDTKISSSFFYDRGRRGEGDDLPSNTLFSDRFEHILGTLSLNSKLSSQVGLDILAYTQQQVFKSFTNRITDGLETSHDTGRSVTNGASAKLTWTAGMHAVVIGSDYSKGTLKDPQLLDGRQGIQKWDLFINDTLVWNKLSVTPGIRYDAADAFGSFV